MTSLPWLMIPGFLVPILFFIHIVIFARLLAKSQASEPAICLARRWKPSRSRPDTTTPGPTPRRRKSFLGTASRPIATASKRRRATLPASAPPPIPQA